MDFAYILPGLAVGTLVGATGVGGGSVMTPLLTSGFGVAPAIAVGTDLVFAALTKSAGTLTHRLQGSVDWRITRLLCLGSLPAAALTILAMKSFDLHGKPALIELLLGFAVSATALAMLWGDKPARLLSRTPGRDSQTAAWATVIGGIILGGLVSLTSIGAGALGAVLLLTLHPSMPAVRVAGTDIAHAVPLAAVAGFGHLWLGTVNFSLLSGLLIGSIPGIVLGSLIGKKLPETVLRRVLAITLLAVAAHLLFKRL